MLLDLYKMPTGTVCVTVMKRVDRMIRRNRNMKEERKEERIKEGRTGGKKG